MGRSKKKKRANRKKRAIAVQESTAQKSTDLGNWSPLEPWLKGADRGDQFSRTKWGAAQSYIVIGYVEKCVELIASGITSLPYSIQRFDRGITGTDEKWTGTEIARSDDPLPQHPLFQLFHNYEDGQYMPLLFRVAASLTLFDELYIELVRKFEDKPVSQYNPLTGLDWLNPLGMSINATNGRIDQYFYSPFDTAKPATFDPFEIAYKHGYNPEDDLRGYPDVLSVLESLEIDFAIQRSVVSHFRNGIQGMATVSPKDGFGNLQNAREGMDDVKKRSRGPENVGGFMYWPRGVDVTAMAYPDYAQITSYSEATGDRILNQFGVPRAILGNSDIAGYKQGDETTYRFYTSNIIPRADDIVKFFNRRIIPLLPADYHMDRLVVDRSEFDRVSENDQRLADIAGTNTKNMLATINEGRIRQGLEEWPPERGDLLIVPAGTIFVSPEDLKSGFVAGGTAEDAAVVEQTSDVEGNGNLPPLPPTEPEPPEAPPALPPGQKSNIDCVKAVMARSQSSVDNWDWSVEKAHKELDAWYTFVKRRGANGLKHLPVFEPNYTRGDIADTIIESFKGYNKSASGLTVKAVFGMVKDWVAVKAIQSTRIEFEDDFEDTLQANIDGKSTTRQTSARLRALIRKADNKAFRDGLSDGGAPGEEPTDAEQVEINQFIAEQSQYVTSLLGTVKSENLESSKGKGAQWYNKSVQPMYDAGFASAGGNKMTEWVLGKTEVHCRSCLGYNGQRHRFKSWMRIGAMPQSDTLACHGDNCDCDLVAVRARARGKLKLIKSIQELMKAKAPDKPAYVYIDLAERDDLIAIQSKLKDIIGDATDIEWQKPDTFHVTLVYTPNISDSELNARTINSIDEFKLGDNPLEIKEVGIFNTDDGQALHLVVNNSVALDSLQSRIFDELKRSGGRAGRIIPMSEYSNPDDYHPHITMAYIPNEIAIPDIEIEPIDLGVDRVVYGREYHDEVHSLKFNESDVSRDQGGQFAPSGGGGGSAADDKPKEPEQEKPEETSVGTVNSQETFETVLNAPGAWGDDGKLTPETAEAAQGYLDSKVGTDEWMDLIQVFQDAGIASRHRRLSSSAKTKNVLPAPIPGENLADISFDIDSEE